ncbi:hypothetical protein [Williamsia sp. Leaf354]|uniref:hypothetical protein n=1 Tax=Williamsia sp. Leaf354 TaxID=1736349 RepID=UPI0012E3E343|nr:hypothetical protein [Williamsia sp. Leaf354]
MLAVACSSESSMPVDGTSSASVAAKSLTDYLLQPSDVPAGFQKQQIPSGATVSPLADVTAGAKVSPTSCKPPESAAAAKEAASAPAALFGDGVGGTTIVAAVGKASAGVNGSVESFRRYNLGDCATHTLTAEVDGAQVTATQTAAPIEVDTAGVNGVVAARIRSMAKASGSNIDATQFVAVLPVPDGAVLVSVSKLRGAPDEAVFRQVVAAAARRIAS